LSPLLLLAGMMGALVLCPPFAAVLSCYCAITLAYSLRLKHLIMLDVVTLAMLYGVRIAAGGVLLDINLSKWLVAFALFLFFCLALVKRATELRVFAAFNKRKLKGRGYEASDLGTLEAMADFVNPRPEPPYRLRPRERLANV
jgi:4-hydroxybenzoate polyprenyltransferase